MPGVLAQKVLYSAGLLALEGARNGIYGAVTQVKLRTGLSTASKSLNYFLATTRH